MKSREMTKVTKNIKIFKFYYFVELLTMQRFHIMLCRKFAITVAKTAIVDAPLCRDNHTTKLHQNKVDCFFFIWSSQYLLGSLPCMQ